MANTNEVEIGQVWTAKVSGHFRKVEVLARDGDSKFFLKNVDTGRDLAKSRTARFLRVLAEPGRTASETELKPAAAAPAEEQPAKPTCDYCCQEVEKVKWNEGRGQAECADCEASCDLADAPLPSLVDMVAMAPEKLAEVAEEQAAAPAPVAPAKPASGRLPKVTAEGDTSIWLDLSQHALASVHGEEPLEFSMAPNGNVSRGGETWRSPSQALGRFTAGKIPGSASWRTFYVVDPSTGEKLAIDSLRPAAKSKGYAYSKPGVRSSSTPRATTGRTLAERVAAKRKQVESTLARLTSQQAELAKLEAALAAAPAAPAAPETPSEPAQQAPAPAPAPLPPAPPAPSSEAPTGTVETIRPVAKPMDEEVASTLTGELSLAQLVKLPMNELRAKAKQLANGSALPKKRMALAEFVVEKQVAARW